MHDVYTKYKFKIIALYVYFNQVVWNASMIITVLN
jgi:hypothetical protein